RQSVGSDHVGMDCAVATAAWKFCDYTDRVSRSVRIQPARPGTRLHDAERTGGTSRANSPQASSRIGSCVGRQCRSAKPWKFRTQFRLVPTPVFGMLRSVSGSFLRPK